MVDGDENSYGVFYGEKKADRNKTKKEARELAKTHITGELKRLFDIRSRQANDLEAALNSGDVLKATLKVDNTNEDKTSEGNE